MQEYPKMLYKEWPQFFVAQDADEAAELIKDGWVAESWADHSKHQCEICRKGFKSALALSGHMKSHKADEG